MSTTTLRVTGMSCSHCVASVKKALEQVPGVKSVDVNLDQSRATVDGPVDAQSLVAAVENEGYGAETL